MIQALPENIAMLVDIFKAATVRPPPFPRPRDECGVVDVRRSVIQVPIDNSAFPNNKIVSIQPHKISLVMFIAAGTSLNLPETATMRITATKFDNSKYNPCIRDIKISTEVEETGRVVEYNLLAEWTNVTNLEFGSDDTRLSTFTNLLRKLNLLLGLPTLIGGSVSAVGNVGFLADNFRWTEKCIPGAKKDEESGQCESLDGLIGTLVKERVDDGVRVCTAHKFQMVLSLACSRTEPVVGQSHSHGEYYGILRFSFVLVNLRQAV
jgi:hypothetical protein